MIIFPFGVLSLGRTQKRSRDHFWRDVFQRDEEKISGEDTEYLKGSTDIYEDLSISGYSLRIMGNSITTTLLLIYIYIYIYISNYGRQAVVDDNNLLKILIL